MKEYLFPLLPLLLAVIAILDLVLRPPASRAAVERRKAAFLLALYVLFIAGLVYLARTSW